MKIKLTLIILIITGSLQVVYSQKWEYVNTLESEWMLKICTQGQDTVYAVGENGLIARSPDRALTWEKQNPVSTYLNDIIFCNHETGFAVGNSGVILKTSDAGDTWTLINSGTTEDINAIASAGLDNIWAVGSNGLVIKSYDAGETWDTEDISDENINLYDIEFKENIGYISGEKGTVLKTTNSGTDWESQTSTTTTETINSLSFSGNRIFALMSSPYSNFGTIIVSEDNEHWSVPKNIYGLTYSLVDNICFLDDNLGFYSYYDWTTGSGLVLWVFKTTDGGQTWILEDMPFSGLNGDVYPDSRSSFAFSEDHSFGYCQIGQILLRAPYTGEFEPEPGQDTKQLNYSEILFEEHDGYLQITNNRKEISLIKIVSSSGAVLCQKQNSNYIDTNSLPKGIYLVNLYFTDNTAGIYKWLKR